MKKRVLIFLSVALVWCASLFAQDVPVGVLVAFKKGSSEGLNQYWGNKVDLMIEDRAVASDKASANAAMTTFFSSHKVNRFDVNHEGRKGESSFIIGTLETASGSFRVNCFFRRVQNKYVIHQIRIDKQND